MGQLGVNYRLAKPDEREAYKDKDPEFCQDRYILVSGVHAEVLPENRRLPKHIVLTDGTVLLLLRSSSTRVLDTQEHKEQHRQMYGDMFLYVPWENEEEFLGNARRSIDDCQAKWNEWGAAAIDLKHQLQMLTRESFLM